MTESRDENGRFEPGHTIGPKFESDGELDPSEQVWQWKRMQIKEQYPNVWERYAVEEDKR